MNIEVISEFLKFLREAEKEYKAAQETEKETESQLQDIDHRLELYTDSYHKTARLGKLICEVRRTRRKAKEAQELNEPVLSWIRDNKSAIKSLERLLGTVRHIREVQEKRAYWPRTDILKDWEKGGAER